MDPYESILDHVFNPAEIAKYYLDYDKMTKETKETNDETTEQQELISLYGSATITIRFENRVQWQKYRKYILKTDWEFDGGQHPYTAQLKEHFTCVDDVERITKRIVELLQLGFDVYSCRWDLETPNEQKVEYIQDGEIKRDVISQ